MKGNQSSPTAAPGPSRATDCLAALALPAGLILALVAVALTAQTTRSRRRDVTGLLRT